MRGESAEARLQYLHSILVDVAGGSDEQAFGLVFLHERDGAGDRIADVDSTYVLERHLCGKKANHAADMSYHAAG